MAKRPTKHGSSWTQSDVAKLRELQRENTPTRVMGVKLGRTPGAIYAKATSGSLSSQRTKAHTTGGSSPEHDRPGTG